MSKIASIAIQADLHLRSLNLNVEVEIADDGEFDIVDVTFGEKNVSLLENLCDHQIDRMKLELSYAIAEYTNERAEWEQAALEDYQDGLAEDKKAERLLH